MNNLEQLNQKQKQLEDAFIKIIKDYCDNYGEEYNESTDPYDIISEIVEWEILRDIDYIEDLEVCLENTTNAIEMYEKGTLKDLHRANKMFEVVVTTVRKNRKKLRDQMEKIEQLIGEYNNIIAVCDKYRK